MRGLFCMAVVLTLKGISAQMAGDPGTANPCDQMLTGPGEDNEHMFEPPATCTLGYVSWMNPQGNLVMAFEKETPFSVCFGQTFYSGTIQEISVESEEGMSTLDVPSFSNPWSCVSTAGEELTVTLKSFSSATNYFDYFVYSVGSSLVAAPTASGAASGPASIEV